MDKDNRSIKPNRCQASVRETNQRELPQNFSPSFLFWFFHLFTDDLDLIQYISGLNFNFPSSDKSHIALDIPATIENKNANIIE